ncbi:DUF3667 domain-containing protein [Flavobacterium soli]|uniref:DUF3667 domain-containing protein n=1 Tax=Flavobacterium soli TaxID=344881 RepID=UPI00146A2B67|nr:DUF3667 domain-containing protein [Flavobacterium soli]
MNKGFLYSIKKILRGPGKTAREFVEGNRVNHYKPILLVFVVAGISAFLTNTLIHPDEIMARFYKSQNLPEIQEKMNIIMFSFIYKYYAIIMLASVPIMAFFTWLAFKKWGYNYYENVVITAYSLVFLQVLTILIVIPLQYAFKDNLHLFMIIPTIISMIIMIGTFIWFYIDLYNQKSAGDVILRLLLLAAILFIVYILLIIIAIIVGVVYAMSTGIDPKTFFPAPK